MTETHNCNGQCRRADAGDDLHELIRMDTQSVECIFLRELRVCFDAEVTRMTPVFLCQATLNW